MFHFTSPLVRSCACRGSEIRVELGVCARSPGLWCLLHAEGERDGDADEVEGSPVGGGWFGESGDGGVAVSHVVAGEGREVVQQVPEAADRLPAGPGLASGLGVGGW